MNDNFDLGELKPSKKRKNSRTKGNTFERGIAKLLNERFNTKDFSRSPGSGAFATTHSLPEHLMIYGDLITPKNFRFCIECKKGYNHINLYSLYNDSSDLWGFIDQCEKDAGKANRQPLVIFKQDRQPTLAITSIGNFLNFDPDLYFIGISNKNRQYKIYKFNDLLKTPDQHWFDPVDLS